MSPRRIAAALLVASLAGAGSGPAHADPGVARRLAALESLVRPDAARAIPPTPPGPPTCAGGRWWRMTAYGVRSRTDRAIRDASIRYGLDAALIRAVIWHESAYDPNAVSSAGAQGLMQLLPETARALHVVCPFDPRDNVLGGTRYLRQLYDRFRSWPLALAAYHAGPTRVARGRIPSETQRYVARVLGSWRLPTRAGGRFARERP